MPPVRGGANAKGSSNKSKADSKQPSTPMLMEGTLCRHVARKPEQLRFALSSDRSLRWYDATNTPSGSIASVQACAIRRDEIEDAAFSLHCAELTLLLHADDASSSEAWIAALVEAGAELAAESTLPRAPTDEEAQVGMQVAADLATVVEWEAHEVLLRRLWDASVGKTHGATFAHQSETWRLVIGFASDDPSLSFVAPDGGGLAALVWLVWYLEAPSSPSNMSLQRHSDIQRLSREQTALSRKAFGERGLPWASAAMRCFLWVCSEFRLFVLASGVSLGAKRCWGLISSRERLHELCAALFESCEREYVKAGAKAADWDSLFEASTSRLRECLAASTGTSNASLVELRHALELLPFGAHQGQVAQPQT
jgi:hypothetical protein